MCLGGFGCENIGGFLMRRDEMGAEQSTQNSGAPGTPGVQNFPMALLLAEDIAINRLLIRKLLNKIFPDLTILEAEDGQQTIELACSKQPQLILMDEQMPIADGSQATVEIRKFGRERGYSPSIIALTGDVSTQNRTRCLESGMDDFITKPVSPEDLYRILSREIHIQTMAALEKENSKAESGQESGQDDASFDPDVLVRLLKIEDIPSFFDDFIQACDQQFDTYAQRLRSGMVEKDLKKLRDTAHSIKGTGLYMRAKELTRLATQIELSCVKGRAESEKVIHDIEQELQAVLAAMKAYRGQYSV
jgi:CheY-like chemotaxis protein